MDLGLTLLIIGALLVFGAKVFGFLVVIVGILFIFDLI